MKLKGYLIVSSNGITKFAKKYPNLGRNEVAVGISLELPDRLFERPQLNATIIIPDSAVLPYEITADVHNEIEHALASVEGIDIKLTVSA